MITQSYQGLSVIIGDYTALYKITQNYNCINILTREILNFFFILRGIAQDYT